MFHWFQILINASHLWHNQSTLSLHPDGIENGCRILLLVSLTCTLLERFKSAISCYLTKRNHRGLEHMFQGLLLRKRTMWSSKGTVPMPNWSCVMTRYLDTNRPKDNKTPSTSTLSIRKRLRKILRDRILASERRGHWNLISSEDMANQYIRERWGVLSSHEHSTPRLFKQVRKQSRLVLWQFIETGHLQLEIDNKVQRYLVYKFRETDEHIILGFFRPDRRCAGM